MIIWNIPIHYLNIPNSYYSDSEKFQLFRRKKPHRNENEKVAQFQKI